VRAVLEGAGRKVVENEEELEALLVQGDAAKRYEYGVTVVLQRNTVVSL
jgi:hypothetical protein